MNARAGLRLGHRLALPIACSLVLAAACGGAQSGDDSAVSGELPSTRTSLVNATAVVSACPGMQRQSAKLATDAIQKLVAPCGAVPGGRAHFSATLLPGGKIELAAPDGDPTDGVVPTCVLQRGLAHKALLKRPCRFDVQLEERKLEAGAK
jgi:hypothetical protein